MCNRFTCPLKPNTHLTLKLLIQGHPLSAKVPHTADFKSAYVSLIIGPRRLQLIRNREVCNLSKKKSWAANLLMWSDLTLGPPSRSNENSQA